MGAEESSTISARLLVPAGAADQLSGGCILAPWQVYRWPSMPWVKARLLIDIGFGGTAEPAPPVPQPATVSSATTIATTVRTASRRHLRRRTRSRPEVTLASLLPTVDIRTCQEA